MEAGLEWGEERLLGRPRDFGEAEADAGPHEWPTLPLRNGARSLLSIALFSKPIKRLSYQIDFYMRLSLKCAHRLSNAPDQCIQRGDLWGITKALPQLNCPVLLPHQRSPYGERVRKTPELSGYCVMIEIIDERVHRMADAAGVDLSTPVVTEELHAIWKMTGAPVAEARLMMQIVGTVRRSPTVARSILYDLDALVRARPELEVIRALCVSGQR